MIFKNIFTVFRTILVAYVISKLKQKSLAGRLQYQWRMM